MHWAWTLLRPMSRNCCDPQIARQDAWLCAVEFEPVSAESLLTGKEQDFSDFATVYRLRSVFHHEQSRAARRASRS